MYVCLCVCVCVCVCVCECAGPVQVRTSLAAAAKSAQVKDVRLIRDKSNNTSRGFCFIEMATVEVRMQEHKKVLRVHVHVPVPVCCDNYVFAPLSALLMQFYR